MTHKCVNCGCTTSKPKQNKNGDCPELGAGDRHYFVKQHNKKYGVY